jgi:hypothetical protein
MTNPIATIVDIYEWILAELRARGHADPAKHTASPPQPKKEERDQT